jgi:hypothetical protein
LGKANATLKAYLKEAVMAAIVFGDASESGCVACLPEGGNVDSMTKDAIEARNVEFRAWVGRRLIGLAPDAADIEFEQQMVPALPSMPPTAGVLVTDDVVTASSVAPFGLVESCIEWYGTDPHIWPEPRSVWTRPGSSGLGWAVATFCANTRAALVQPSPAITSLNDQDVDATLVTLFTMRIDASPNPFRDHLERFCGVIGPICFGGRDGTETLRLTSWELDGVPSIVVLLPEAYIRHHIGEYAVSAPPVHARPLLMSSSVFVLGTAVQIASGELTEVDADAFRATLGPRIFWSDTTAPIGVHEPSPPLARPPFRTQTDVEFTHPAAAISPVASKAAFSVSCTSADMLVGVRIRWVIENGRPVLDAATGPGENQVLKEI